MVQTAILMILVLVINCNVDGSVDLYHNNALKLATSSEGITVTGNTMVSEGSSFKFGGNNARIMGHSGNHRIQFLAAGYEQARLQGGLFRIGNVESSQDDGKLSVSETKNYSSGIARQQINVRDNQAYTVTDNGGAIAFSGKYNSSAYTTFAQIEGVKANNTDGNYEGGLKFAARANGSSMNTIGRWDAHGIKFGGDTAAANGLSDYEEGTWTPTTNIGYSSATGTYVKIGNVVHIAMNASTNAGPGDNSQATSVSGLPYSASPGDQISGSTFITGLNQNLYLEIGGSSFSIRDNANNTSITRGEYGSAVHRCSATYITS